ncbi:MAG: ABC-type transport auxiliary lipoprotein family protein, partial [Pseudomonadota bacterium]
RILAGTDLIARDRSGAIRLIDDVEWADRSTRLMQLTLLDYLASDAGGVALLPETGARAAFELTWRVSEFSLMGNRAIARLELTLLDGSSREPLVQRVVSSEITANGSSNSSRASALAAAGRDAVEQAAQFVSKHAKSVAAGPAGSR